ncbi:MAG: 3,4-dihydroxy-2-butanone-4-phosphate synthase [Alphaproteobacteria bacterium]|nr:3,4-dihydroxy-2-butanone-4-phosphate synthase [Alphaproteobacteria bacterium]MCY4318804.1 3,4-dihydroxy-2-butanone-4-phosphate synthase [Alphaproteobacteria bacterium]
MVSNLDGLVRAPRTTDDLGYLSPIEEIIEEARNGRMFILVDDEDRENEGDLIIPAQMATPDAINFMAKHGRGLICLALTPARVKELRLPLMPRENEQRQSTAFTVSIEAKDGVTTGISAPDRARTIAVAIDPDRDGGDIATPGHVFPLEAREGGVLVRAGHTEAAVDIARLAGLNPSGVICEIMNDDGTMARLPDLVPFAQFHNLKIGAIEDLIAWRRRRDVLVEQVVQSEFESRYGGHFKLIIYRNRIDGVEHQVLVKGDLSSDEPVLVRAHAFNILEDVLGDQHRGRGGELQRSMMAIGREGRGVVMLLRERLPSLLSARIRAEIDSREMRGKPPLRDYGVGAQILRDLGVVNMILLSDSDRHVVGLDGYELRIVGRRSIPEEEG